MSNIFKDAVCTYMYIYVDGINIIDIHTLSWAYAKNKILLYVFEKRQELIDM